MPVVPYAEPVSINTVTMSAPTSSRLATILSHPLNPYVAAFSAAGRLFVDADTATTPTSRNWNFSARPVLESA